MATQKQLELVKKLISNNSKINGDDKHSSVVWIRETDTSLDLVEQWKNIKTDEWEQAGIMLSSIALETIIHIAEVAEVNWLVHNKNNWITILIF